MKEPLYKRIAGAYSVFVHENRSKHISVTAICPGPELNKTIKVVFVQKKAYPPNRLITYVKLTTRISVMEVAGKKGNFELREPTQRFRSLSVEKFKELLKPGFYIEFYVLD